MRLIFATEARFVKDAEGKIYGNAAFDEKLWERYLNVFTEVFVVARVLFVHNYTGNLKYISLNKNVKVVELPYFIGLKEFILKFFQTRNLIKQLVIDNMEARFICRVPGNIGSIVASELNKVKKAYAIEVVGDPWDVFAPGSIRHIFLPFIRIASMLKLKQVVKNATAVLYVTNYTLQKRYPARKAKFTTFASNVQLDKSNLSKYPKTLQIKKFYQIISIGSLDQMYKSPDVVLKAIRKLNDEGINCSLTWLGGGKFQKPMELMAIELGIGKFVNFKGNVDKNEVQFGLSNSDLFVLASKTEGLPRVVIEAMAEGLPCIATRVGGIPELLDEEVLVTKNSVDELSKKIKKILTDQDFYNKQAMRNLDEAKDYTEDILSERRNSFYKYIVDNL